MWTSDFWHPALSMNDLFDELAIVVETFSRCVIRNRTVGVDIGGGEIRAWPAITVWKADPCINDARELNVYFPNGPRNAYMRSFSIVLPWMDEDYEGEEDGGVKEECGE